MLHNVDLDQLPDNGLRLLKMFDNIPTPSMHEINMHFYNSSINGIKQSTKEDMAKWYFADILLKPFGSKNAKQLMIASMTNLELLNAALNPSLLSGSNLDPTELIKIVHREITGRLLRIEKDPNKPLEIERLLLTKNQVFHKKTKEMIDFQSVEDIVYDNFAKESKKIHDLFTFMQEESNNVEKNTLLTDILLTWTVPTEKNTENLLKMRDQFLALQARIPELKTVMHTDRRPWLSLLHFAFVALGSLVVIGLPYTFYSIYTSNRDKGTVLFTHAPQGMKASKATEKSLLKLGQVIPSQ